MAERLRDAASRYLLTAVDSPIDWHPWGEEAFERARVEDKPILLDIGAVWCHWCHVMDHQTYEDDQVVERLLRDYVCIKVDRDERPDVDVRYQRAVGAITGSGGWPLTAFLTPDGDVFYGGTFFPPTDAHGRPGFRTVLEQIKQTYDQDRAKVEHSAEHLREALERHAAPGEAAPLDASLLQPVSEMLLKAHDTKFGGFGGAPKFPHTGALGLALLMHQRTGDNEMLRLVERTLDKMAAGGIHDRVEGGFHRYSVDAHWTVPHFEKMAYDNAELLRVYANAYGVTDDERLRTVADGIVDWFVLHGDPDGGFAGSEDADQGPEDDGDYFTWTLDEVRAAMHDDEAIRAAPAEGITPDALFAYARSRFGVEAKGDMHHDPTRNVLEIEATVEDAAKEAGIEPEQATDLDGMVRERLRVVRLRRARPYVDPTRFTDWNAMTCSAFLEAGARFENAAMVIRAMTTLDRLVKEAWDDERGWLHRPRGDGGEAAWGFLDDQVWAGLALVDAIRFAGRTDLLPLANKTADRLLELWADPDGDALVDVSRQLREQAVAAPLTRPHRPFMDQGAAGGNAIGALFLLRLGRLTERPELVERAKAVLASFAGEAPGANIFAATWFQAVDEALADPPLVTVYGTSDDPATEALLQVARAAPRSGLLVLHVAPDAPEAAPSYLRDFVTNEDLIKEGARALVCRGTHCDTLTGDPEALYMRILDRSAPVA